MRVLTTGRTALSLAVVAGVLAIALPASAGAPAPAGRPAGASTTGVVLGPAVAYVREPDGTVRRVR